MIQEINLYQENILFGEKRRKVPRYVIYSGLLLAALTLFSIVSVMDLQHRQALLSKNQQELRDIKQQVNHLTTAHQPIPLDALLAGQIKELQIINDQLGQTIALLGSKNLARPEGFSKYLLAFSRQTLTNVWLTALHIDEANRSLVIEGSTLEAEKITDFLNQLQKESIFKGSFFEKMTLEKSSTRPGQLDFRLSTVEPTKKPADGK